MQVLLCILNNSIKHQSFIYTELTMKTVLFLTIQFYISRKFSSIWPIDRTLSGTTTPGQSGPRSDGDEEVLHILKSSSIIGTSCYIQDTRLGVLLLCRDAVDVFCSPSGLDHMTLLEGSLTPLQRRSRCILQPQLTVSKISLVEFKIISFLNVLL